jgi:hypothetical protein
MFDDLSNAQKAMLVSGVLLAYIGPVVADWMKRYAWLRERAVTVNFLVTATAFLIPWAIATGGDLSTLLDYVLLGSGVAGMTGAAENMKRTSATNRLLTEGQRIAAALPPLSPEHAAIPPAALGDPAYLRRLLAVAEGRASATAAIDQPPAAADATEGPK